MKIAPAHCAGIVLAVLFAANFTQPGFAWGKRAHTIINRVAAESLPDDLPSFLRSRQAADEIAWLGDEPDRWRSAAEPELSAAQAPEHFIDLEIANQAAPAGLPPERTDFLRDLTIAQSRQPQLADKFTPQTVGQLPWAFEEWFERLRLDMREYRDIHSGHGDTHGIGIAILYDIGVLGHYIADGSQPLHTTINYDGWVEAQNPEHFSRRHGIHRRFETTFVDRNIDAADVRPLVPRKARILDSPFQNFVSYLRASHAQVQELYRLDRSGGFRGHGTARSRTFTETRIAAGAAMLRDAIATAWIESADGATRGHGRAAQAASKKKHSAARPTP
jgi:hypothetical protein